MMRPDPVSAEIGVDLVPVRACHLRDGMGDVPDPLADDGRRDRGIQSPLGRVDDREILVARGADHERDRRIGDPAVDRRREIQRHEVAVPHRVVERQSVQHRVVHRRADHLAERAGAERRVVVDVARLRSGAPDHLVRATVDREQVGADTWSRRAAWRAPPPRTAPRGAWPRSRRECATRSSGSFRLTHSVRTAAPPLRAGESGRMLRARRRHGSLGTPRGVPSRLCGYVERSTSG